jgi:hypothetical protein
MLELYAEPLVMEDLPEQGLVEGPFLFERNGIYYMTYPHVQNNTERLEYAIGDNPMGPFKVTGVIMDELPSGCWTNHQSIIEFNGQWYLFYHDNDLSPKFDKNRSVRIDSLFFNDDGTIRKVMPTLRGVGLTDASREIQTDRYSHLSDDGVTVAFLDTLDRFKGWKAEFNRSGAWLQYNGVDFGKGEFKTVMIRGRSETGGLLQIRLNSAQGPVIANVKIRKGGGWIICTAPVSGIRPGIQNLVTVLKGNNVVEADWIRFD